ncbi:hypothetical protein QBA54_07435 [Streptomyces sp. B21-108]|uniref:hypothetical protein n=1 Tax=Streptomyces sp. B21-108 TaxID=3039419 RepID=UPI002FF3D0D9
MLLTQDGLRALADFTINASPDYDEDFNRVEGNDGITLACTQRHDGKLWQKKWPGHVAAPTLRDLVLVAQMHWGREHRAEQAETAEVEVAK